MGVCLDVGGVKVFGVGESRSAGFSVATPPRAGVYRRSILFALVARSEVLHVYVPPVVRSSRQKPPAPPSGRRDSARAGRRPRGRDVRRPRHSLGGPNAGL